VSTFEQFLLEPAVVSETSPEPAGLLTQVRRRGPLRMMYGETYDRFGPTFDSLKYYSWLGLASRLLAAEGIEAAAEVVIADTATTRNASPEDAERLLRSGATHAERMNQVCTDLGLPVSVVLMSSFIDSVPFQERLEEVRKTFAASPVAAESIRQTVPERFREEEEAKGWVYALEEVATIAPYDIKVGPPRERFYDDPARVVAGVVGWNPLCSVFLRPALPLGLPPSTFVRDRDLATFGVTPYKAGSLGLQANRVLLDQQMRKSAQELLTATVPIPKPGVPNPMLEFANTCELIRWAAGGPAPDAFPSARFLAGEIKKDDLVAGCLSVIEQVADRLRF
jgi:hypothetical protein